MCCTILSAAAQDSLWWQRTTVYQIYPRSFKDSNGDGIGDLEGVISKLDYLKDLGIETIWLSPFFSSPQQDYGYDISDYRGVAPEYGDTNTVNRLIKEIHLRGMKVVFDMVMNHTSDQHPWFQESRQSNNNPKSDWYVWRDGKGKHHNKPPNNWKASIGGSGWHYDETRKQYYWSSFLSFQPDLNYYNPEVKKAMFANVRYWLDRGVDGFRLDIFNSIYEDSSFRNNPFRFKAIPSATDPDGFFQHMKYTVNHPLDSVFAKELRAVINEYQPARFLVGEVFGNNKTLRHFIGDKQDGLNLVFLFKTLDRKFKAKAYKKLLTEFEKDYPAPYLLTFVYSNHDRKRGISRLGNDVRKAKLLAMIQLTTRAVPFIYQGEEIGMEQAHIPLKQAKDLLALKYSNIPQWLVTLSPESLNRDECRTPMQWDSTANAGFSQGGAPWLPVNGNYKRINVVKEEGDSSSLLLFYKDLLAWRKRDHAVMTKQLTPIEHLPNGILAYSRDDVIVFVNFTKHTKKFKMPFSGRVMVGTEHVETTGNNLYVPPYGGAVVRGLIFSGVRN